MRDRSVTDFLELAGGIRAVHEQVDVLAALDTAARVAKATGSEGTVILADSGLSTNGVIDFRQEGMLDAVPDDLAAYLDNKSISPDLRGLTVFLVGLGETAPPQESLSRPQRTNVVNIWSSIARNGEAACVSAIDQPRTTEAPDDVPQVAAVPVPAVPGFVPVQMGELLLPNDRRRIPAGRAVQPGLGRLQRSDGGRCHPGTGRWSG